MTDNPERHGPFIPFNRASFVGREEEYVRQALAAGHISGDGAFTKACNTELSTVLAGAPVLLTTSCTHALELAALLIGIKPGDEVILPSFTFVSTANAFALRGARLRFADIRPDTLNVDPGALAAQLGPQTVAVVVVHYAGVACDIDAVSEIAAGHGAAVVEDAAHAIGASHRGRPLGTMGRFAALSFHETKNLTCGEGGAIVLNDAADLERAEIVREKGTNRARFFRGQVDKYTWVDLGSSYLPSDILAAILLGQLEHREEIQARRLQIWERYRAELADWALENGVQLPHVPAETIHPGHIFYMLLPDAECRARMIRHLRSQNILAVFHYVPLHLSPMGLRHGGQPGACPVTESVSERLVRLPLFYSLTPGDQSRVISAVREFST